MCACLHCRCGGGGKEVKGKPAAWSVCLLLVTDKAETAPMYKALSNVYAGKVCISQGHRPINLIRAAGYGLVLVFIFSSPCVWVGEVDKLRP